MLRASPSVFRLQGGLCEFLFFLLGKHVAIQIQNYSQGIHVFTESRPWCIQILGGIMSIFVFFCQVKHEHVHVAI